MQEDGGDGDVGSDEDADVSGGGVKEVASGEASGVLTISLFMFILPSSGTLERGSDAGDDRGK